MVRETFIRDYFINRLYIRNYFSTTYLFIYHVNCSISTQTKDGSRYLGNFCQNKSPYRHIDVVDCHKLCHIHDYK